MSVEEAVDDIVIRGVSELRKNAFGDDIEDAKNLAWTREQAWVLMKQLVKQPEVSATGRHDLANLIECVAMIDLVSRRPHGLPLQG